MVCLRMDVLGNHLSPLSLAAVTEQVVGVPPYVDALDCMVIWFYILESDVVEDKGLSSVPRAGWS